MAGVGASIVAVRRQRQVAVVLLPFLLLVEAASCFHLPPPSVSSRSAAPASALSLTPSSSSSLTSAGFPSQRSPATAGPVNKSPTTTFAACLRPPTATPRQRRSSSTTTTTTTSLGQSVEGDFDDPDALSRAQQEVAAGSFKARIRALYKFTRPHTIRGTILASVAGVVRALVDTPGASLSQTDWSALLPKAFVGMVALLLGNVFITGINQIYDRDIDQMNKPFLPVASGEMSERFAWVAVALSGIVGPLIVYAKFPPLLFRLYATGLLLGGIYSVPPIRTKRNPVLAGLTIAVVRGFLLNFGVYYAARDALGVPFAWSPKVAFIARFMTVFATIIAVTKDLPDVDGDKAYQIETFATKLGVAKIARGATFCLFANYVQAIVTGGLSAASSAATKKSSFNSIPMIGGHAALAAILVWRYRQLDPDSMPSVKTFYKHIWDLFYLEYVLYALI